jgi:hypothetical protein
MHAAKKYSKMNHKVNIEDIFFFCFYMTVEKVGHVLLYFIKGILCLFSIRA